VDEPTAIGPAENPIEDVEARKTQATTEGVDAQNANEFDSRLGLAGAEAKQFSKPGNASSDHSSSSRFAADEAR
jgi:hypothetical protein